MCLLETNNTDCSEKCQPVAGPLDVVYVYATQKPLLGE